MEPVEFRVEGLYLHTTQQEPFTCFDGPSAWNEWKWMMDWVGRFDLGRFFSRPGNINLDVRRGDRVKTLHLNVGFGDRGRTLKMTQLVIVTLCEWITAAVTDFDCLNLAVIKEV